MALQWNNYDTWEASSVKLYRRVDIILSCIQRSSSQTYLIAFPEKFSNERHRNEIVPLSSLISIKLETQPILA